jgi:hypothetical protein
MAGYSPLIPPGRPGCGRRPAAAGGRGKGARNLCSWCLNEKVGDGLVGVSPGDVAPVFGDVTGEDRTGLESGVGVGLAVGFGFGLLV